MSSSPDYKKPGRFDVHVICFNERDSNGNGVVDELHGNAHVNPFSEDSRLPALHRIDRDGSSPSQRWYYYQISAQAKGGMLHRRITTATGATGSAWFGGPIIDNHGPAAMLYWCALSHFKKFGGDLSTLAAGFSPAARGGRQDVELVAEAVVATSSTTSASAALLANQHVSGS